MRKFLLLFLLTTAAFAQNYTGAYSFDTGVWAPITTTSSSNPLPGGSSEPPPAALTCYSTTLHTWVAWTAASCGSGGGGGGSGTVLSGSGYAIPAYALAAGTVVGPSHVVTSATGNDLTIPGIETVGDESSLPADLQNYTGASNLISVSTGSGVGFGVETYKAASSGLSIWGVVLSPGGVGVEGDILVSSGASGALGVGVAGTADPQDATSTNTTLIGVQGDTAGFNNGVVLSIGLDAKAENADLATGTAIGVHVANLINGFNTFAIKSDAVAASYFHSATFQLDNITGHGSAGVVGIDTSGNLSVYVKTTSTNHAICWKSATALGFCSTVVAADGSCTCN